MVQSIVLPPLVNWTQTHFSAILESTNPSDFTQAFNDFVSQNVSITWNGSPISRDSYQNALSGQQGASNVAFDLATASPQNPDQYDGDASFCYTAQYGVETLVVSSCFNVTVEVDPSIPQPSLGPIRGYFDGRRVFSLSQGTAGSLDDTD